MAIPTWVDTAGFVSGNADITAYGRDSGWTTQRGTTSIVTSAFVADAGTYSSILSNRDRRFDPNYTSSPYSPDLVPDVPFTKVATFAATPHSVFTGFVDEWPQLYPVLGKDQTVDLSASDAIRFFSEAQYALTARRRAEPSGARIQAVVDATGWPGPTDIDPGVSVVGPLALGVVSAWSHMQDVCAAEFGDLYVAKDGTLTFRDRNRTVTETRSIVSQATFTDATGLKYADVTMGSPPIVNDCTITFNDKGSQVNAQNATSIAKPWGLKSLNLTLPLEGRTQAQALADWLVFLYKNPITTFTSITIKPERDATNLFPQILSRELSDLITVTRTPIGGGSALTRTCWIRGISHSYANHAWTSTTFTLQDASWVAGLARFDVDVFDDADKFFSF